MVRCHPLRAPRAQCRRTRMPKKKKPKAVMVDGIPITPVSPAEHRRLDRRIKKKYEKLRRRYPEVHGKKVDWISHTGMRKDTCLSTSGSQMERTSRSCAAQQSSRTSLI